MLHSKKLVGQIFHKNRASVFKAHSFFGIFLTDNLYKSDIFLLCGTVLRTDAGEAVDFFSSRGKCKIQKF